MLSLTFFSLFSHLWCGEKIISILRINGSGGLPSKHKIKVTLPSMCRLNIFLSSFMYTLSLKLIKTRHYGNFTDTVFKQAYLVVFPLVYRTDVLHPIFCLSHTQGTLSHFKEQYQVPSTGLATWDKCGQLAGSDPLGIKKPTLIHCLSSSGNDLKKLFLQPYSSLSHFRCGVNGVTWRVDVGEEKGGGKLK